MQGLLFISSVGVFDGQVYVQPSDKLQKNVSNMAELYRRGVTLFGDIPRVRWAPYLASGVYF